MPNQSRRHAHSTERKLGEKDRRLNLIASEENRGQFYCFTSIDTKKKMRKEKKNKRKK